ncbi:ribonuclease R [Pantoea sp. Aalb]|uniref:ribonuclease R n=1 Tax=Pantoea sp. Aalb TaxID=2576762 RepID=UPI00132BDBD3|nr:ribonuclease R [Pantoea sp. Aalb]MXP67682.1 ribonuclease R [Pantoea sp. Aalb]
MLKDPFKEREAIKYKNPIPSREFILTVLKKRKKPTSRHKIAQKLNISNQEQLEALRRRLRAMERDGQLIFTRRQCYALPERLDLLRGKVIAHRDGYGFLRVEGKKHDFYLSHVQMKFCLHGDIILAQPGNLDNKNRCNARVVRILEPRNSQIIGRYLINSGIGFVVPDDNRLNFDIIIPQGNEHNAIIGSIVVVEIIKRAIRHTKAIGKITEVLGNNMGTELAINIALRTHEIPYNWSEEVLKETFKFQKEYIPEVTKKNRRDLRELPFVTIDNEDAFDLDDAVYCEKKSNGCWRLLVAIADVSYYVRPGTELDKVAYQRGTSVYFPSQVIPMLPEVLSNGVCSLNQHVDRLCMVCEMTVSIHGKLTSYKHYEALINSHARLTYTKVWNILEGNQKLCKQYSTLIKHLNNLYQVYKVLETARKERGGISFETEEVKFIFNTNRRIERIERIVPNYAYKIIEECMILANIASAHFVEKNKEPSLFRDHDYPSDDSISSFRSVLKELGLNLSGGAKPKPIDYAHLLKQTINRDDSEMLNTMLLRSMKQAVYDFKNRGHFGLALASYTHFTSPIRRYPDLLLHRAIKYIIAKKSGNIIVNNSTFTGGYHYDLQQMLQFGKHCSMTERRADEATRNVSDWLKCDFMQNQVGKIFNGIISSVTGFGFFVRLNHLCIDGLVHVSVLDNDYYHFDSVGQRLIGESGSCIYCLGDAVEVQVDKVHIEERKIDFSLISSNRQRIFRHKCKINNRSIYNF